MQFRFPLIRLVLLLALGQSAVEAATLTNGSLTISIRDDNGAIGDVQFGGSTFYLPGAPVSDYGFQNGTSTSTFARLTTEGFVQGPISITSVSASGGTVTASGTYQGVVAFTRTYSLVPGTDALEIQIALSNPGASPIALRWYDTFDPDQGSPLGRGFSTFNDVFEIDPGFSVGQASDSGGLTVVMGSPSPGSVVASGGPFRIDSGFALNGFLSNPVDGNHSFADQGTHVGGELTLGPGASTTLVYYHAYGLSEAAAQTAFVDASVASCFQIDAIDDLYSVINDGAVHQLLVLSNDECDDDEPISVSPQPGDLKPDRGGVAITDGTRVSYTPASGFVGFEEFSYTAEDAGLDGGSDPPAVDRDMARVVVNVAEDLLPDAVDDVATTQQNQAVVIDVLANDSLGNPPTTVSIATAAAHGTTTVQSDGSIRYAPGFDFFGEDDFEYRSTDANGDSDVATVEVDVFFVRGPVPIDVIPNDPGNNLNLSGGPGSGFKLAILSIGQLLDAPGQIDPLTLKLGPRQANIWGDPQVRDVDHDGDDDLIVKFLTDQTGIACGDTHVNLTGRTVDSQPITGVDAINTFKCPRVRKRH